MDVIINNKNNNLSDGDSPKDLSKSIITRKIHIPSQLNSSSDLDDLKPSKQGSKNDDQSNFSKTGIKNMFYNR